jgi:hypothetical protein
LNKLEFPSPKDIFYQDWFNLACWFWRRRVLNIFSVFLLFCYISPLGERQSPSFEQTWIPSPKDDLCQVWLKLAQWFWKRSRKCKSFTDRQTTDKRRSE